MCAILRKYISTIFGRSNLGMGPGTLAINLLLIISGSVQVCEFNNIFVLGYSLNGRNLVTGYFLDVDIIKL